MLSASAFDFDLAYSGYHKNLIQQLFIIISLVLFYLRVRSFGVVRIGISDPRSHGSWYIKGADKFTLVTDSSVSLMYHDPSDLGSLIRIRITPKERNLSKPLFSLFL